MAPMTLTHEEAASDERTSYPAQGLRLSDVEAVAAQRLDEPANGSLMDALANVATDNAPDHHGDTSGAPTIATAPNATAEPLVPLLDAHAAPTSQEQARRLPDPFGPMPTPPVLDMGLPFALPTERTAEPAAATDQASAGEPEGAQAELQKQEEALQEAVSTPPEAPAPEPPQPTAFSVTAAEPSTPASKLQPLSSALDTAVKLAADANAAAAALENLKQMLERRLPERSPPRPTVHASPRTLAAAPPAQAKAQLPLHAVRNGRGQTALRPAVLPEPARRMPVERRRLDVRGFFAGFALSWAFGVVLYLFLTAG
jgi:hypothetical protein